MRDGIEGVRRHLDQVAVKIPALHRAMNMSDGKASLKREELDQVLDHLTLLESEGFVVTLPGIENMQRLSARVQLVEQPDADGSPQPWFEFNASDILWDGQPTDYVPLIQKFKAGVAFEEKPTGAS